MACENKALGKEIWASFWRNIKGYKNLLTRQFTTGTLLFQGQAGCQFLKKKRKLIKCFIWLLLWDECYSWVVWPGILMSQCWVLSSNMWHVKRCVKWTPTLSKKRKLNTWHSWQSVLWAHLSAASWMHMDYISSLTPVSPIGSCGTIRKHSPDLTLVCA